MPRKIRPGTSSGPRKIDGVGGIRELTGKSMDVVQELFTVNRLTVTPRNDIVDGVRQ